MSNWFISNSEDNVPDLFEDADALEEVVRMDQAIDEFFIQQFGCREEEFELNR